METLDGLSSIARDPRGRPGAREPPRSLSALADGLATSPRWSGSAPSRGETGDQCVRQARDCAATPPSRRRCAVRCPQRGELPARRSTGRRGSPRRMTARRVSTTPSRARARGGSRQAPRAATSPTGAGASQTPARCPVHATGGRANVEDLLGIAEGHVDRLSSTSEPSPARVGASTKKSSRRRFDPAQPATSM